MTRRFQEKVMCQKWHVDFRKSNVSKIAHKFWGNNEVDEWMTYGQV